MLRKIFVQRVEELGWECGIDEIDGSTEVLDEKGSKNCYLWINEDFEFGIVTIEANFANLSLPEKEKLFDLGVRYARTPLDERYLSEEEITILTHLGENFKTILQDSSGSLFVTGDVRHANITEMFPSLFNFVKRGEKYSIEELLSE